MLVYCSPLLHPASVLLGLPTRNSSLVPIATPESRKTCIYGLMNSINWPALSVWVFMVEHCSENAEAAGLNPVQEAPKNFSGGYFAIT